MLFFVRPVRLVAFLAVLALAACETAEERAEGHYQNALALLEENEIEKAKIEFRNVFSLNGQHQEARLRYATLLSEEGSYEEASGQFLRLVEQDPNNAAARRELGRLMLVVGNFEEASRHIEAAYRLAPEDPVVETLQATMEYRSGDREGALDRVERLLAADPDNVDARLIVISDRINERDNLTALSMVDDALTREPDNTVLNAIRLSVLEALGRNEEMGAQLVRMVELDPENQALRNSLYTWHLRNNDLDAAEAVLRTLLAEDPANADSAATFTQFLINFRSLDAARAELEARRDAPDPERALFMRLLSSLELEDGNPERAIALMEEEIARLEDTDLLNQARNQMALLMRSEGQMVRARELVEAVLASDPSNVDALLERGRQRLLEDDHTGAINDLRAALNEEPNNSTVLTVLAGAHQRNGSPDLARERLALAVDVSRRGVFESLRYAEFLAAEGNINVATNVISDALVQRPRNVELLSALGQLHLQSGAMEEADRIAARLEAIGTPEAQRLSTAIRARVLTARQDVAGSIDLLLGQVAEDESDLRARRDLVINYLMTDDAAAAEGFLESEIAADPEDNYARFLLAGVYAVSGKLEEAEETYQVLIEATRTDAPADAARAYEALAAVYNMQGRVDDALAMIDAGIETDPTDTRLQVIKAGWLERQGEFDAAIAIYEGLYALDSGNTVIANNLASLLAEHRTDTESLERAGRVAQRLRVTENPAFLDTYGWVMHRLGNHEQALDPLVRAARALPEVALVRYHLGVVYDTLGQDEEAREHLGHALSIAGPSNLLPPEALADARARLDALSAEPAAGDAAAGDSP